MGLGSAWVREASSDLPPRRVKEEEKERIVVRRSKEGGVRTGWKGIVSRTDIGLFRREDYAMPRKEGGVLVSDREQTTAG